MQGIQYEVKSGELIVRIKLNQDFGSSSTGKSKIIATTSGYIPITEGERNVKLSLNLIEVKR